MGIDLDCRFLFRRPTPCAAREGNTMTATPDPDVYIDAPLSKALFDLDAASDVVDQEFRILETALSNELYDLRKHVCDTLGWTR